jgi:16S rRNA (uracil1498-N3)-methyltransferase
MSDRFYSAAPINSERAALEGPEAHHLLHVMRAAVGQQVTLFDNSGAEFPAVIENLNRASVQLRVIERIETSRELPYTLTVGVALPKGDRQKWLVEKLTELGVTTLVPLETARGVAQPTDAARQRLERSAIEASKQSGRNRLMQIASPQAFDQWVSQAHDPIAGGPGPPDERLLLAHPGGVALSECRLTEPLPTRIAIGPEGGLTDDEVAHAISNEWRRISLGPRILRVETAAVALTAAITLR